MGTYSGKLIMKTIILISLSGIRQEFVTFQIHIDVPIKSMYIIKLIVYSMYMVNNALRHISNIPRLPSIIPKMKFAHLQCHYGLSL